VKVGDAKKGKYAHEPTKTELRAGGEGRNGKVLITLMFF